MIRIILHYLEFLYYFCFKFRSMRIVARKVLEKVDKKGGGKKQERKSTTSFN